MLAVLKQQLDSLKATYNNRQGQFQNIETQIKNLESQILQDKLNIADLESIRITLQETTDEARKLYSENLSKVVTSALQHTLGPDFRFIIEFKESRGKPEAHFFVEHEIGNKTIRSSPEKAMGGGVVDICGLSLQAASKRLCKDPALNGPMLLDEPAKMVSQGYAIRLGQFLKFISKEFDTQIIGVTHQQYLADQADKCFNVEIQGDGTKVTEKVGIQNVQLQQQPGTVQVP